MEEHQSDTEWLLMEIRKAGYNVGVAHILDRATCDVVHMLDATDAKTGERWTVQAPTQYAAAVELAVRLGWDFEE